MPLATAVDGSATYGTERGAAAFDARMPAPVTIAYDEMSFPLPPTPQRFDDMVAAVLRSLREPPTMLNQMFFSHRNLDMLQRGLLARVKEKLHVRISRQPDRAMLLLMRRVYLQTASNSKSRKKVLAEVARLNNLVLQKAEEIVSQSIIRYVLYRKSLAQPKVLPHPAEAVRMPRWVVGSPVPPRNLNDVRM